MENRIEKEGKYYLYAHYRKDNGNPFYIGIGTKKLNSAPTNKGVYSRAYTKTSRNDYWKNIVAKTDYEVEILLESDDYKFIQKKEVEFIALYGRKVNAGTLVNITEGGDGVIGVPHSRESIAKRSTVVIKSNKLFYEGKVFPTKMGGDIKIVTYIDAHNVTIQFLEGGEHRKVGIYEVRRGILKNNFKPSVAGIGFLGGDITNKKAHTNWISLLTTYSKIRYIDIEWYNFQNFAKWFENNYNPIKMQDWVLCTSSTIENNKHIDSNNCFYLPLELSNQLKKSKGYSIRKDGAISAKFLGKHLGYFKNKEEAEEKYIEVKIKYIVELAIKYRDNLTLHAFNTLSNLKINTYANTL